MTVGELKKCLEGVKDDSLPVTYLPPDTSLNSAFDVKGALLVENTTSETDALKGVYLLEG